MTLPYEKKIAKKLQRFLTTDQKQQRIDDLEHDLAIFQRNTNDILPRFVTMDKTWIKRYTPEPNKPSPAVGSWRKPP